MTNKFLLNLLGFNPDLTSRQSRGDSVSILSRQSDLLTYLGRIAAILLLFLTIGVGNVWGAIAAGTYELCTSTSDLEAGAHYIIASGTSGSVYCISNVSQSNYREIVSATVSNDKIAVASNSTIMTFTLGGSTDAWTFYTDNYAGTAGYLASAASGNNNYCRVISTSTTGTISISNNVATIALNPHSTRKYLKYNGGSSRFACYSSGQADVYLYKLAASCDDITPTLSYTSTNLTIGGGNSSSPTLNKDGSSGAVTWESDDEDVATVDESGIVSPVGTGTCNITASIAAAGGKCAGEVSVEFTVTRTITYYVGSTSYTVGGIDGETLVSTLPASPSSCDGVNYPHFYGWKNGSISGSTTTAPTILSTETVSSSSAANTYYAVFTDVVPSAGWEKLTSISASNIGDEVVFVYDGLTKYEMTGVASNLGTATERDEIPDDIAGTFTMTIEKGYDNTGYSFKNGTKYIRHNADKKIELSTTKDALSSWTPSGSSGDFKLQNNSATTYSLQYNVGSPRWTDYTSSQGAFQIYKRGTGGTVNYITTCCTQLGSLNGSFSRTIFHRIYAFL